MERNDRKRPAREAAPGATRRAIASWRIWISGISLTVMLAAGLTLCLATPSYQAEARILIGRKNAGLIGLRSFLVAPDQDAKISAQSKSQIGLFASRDLARRAIKDLGIDSNPEFDPLARGLGPASRALVLLGLKRDPARMSQQERILQSYEERLSIDTEPHAKLVTIGFRSEDRLLAADAANRIADLFLEMRAQAAAASGGSADARIVTRATAPRQPIYPAEALLAVFGLSATLVTMAGAIGARPRLRASQEPSSQSSAPEPHPIGPLPILARTPEPTPMETRATNAIVGSNHSNHPQEAATLAARISARRRDTTGLCIIVASPAGAATSHRTAMALGRQLGLVGHAIVVGLDRAAMLDSEAEAEPAACTIGFTDVVAGKASFAQAIRRDPTSRLHFVPAGSDIPLDHADATKEIETLAGTYDFVLLLAPPLGRDDIAKRLAAESDFVVLQDSGRDTAAMIEAKAELVASGAREVLTLRAVHVLRRHAEPNFEAARLTSSARVADTGHRLGHRAFRSI